MSSAETEKLTLNDGRTNFGHLEASGRDRVVDGSNVLGGDQTVELCLEVAGHAVCPDGRGDGRADGTAEAGPEGEDGDGAGHVGVRDRGLGGDLRADDREGALKHRERLVMMSKGERKIMKTHSETDQDLRHDEGGVGGVVARGVEDETHSDGSDCDTSELYPLQKKLSVSSLQQGSLDRGEHQRAPCSCGTSAGDRRR